MRSDDFETFGIYSNAESRRPEFVVQIEYDDETLSFSSGSAPVNIGGECIENTVSGISSTTQKVLPLEGRAEIGGVTVKLLDDWSARVAYYWAAARAQADTDPLDFENKYPFEIEFKVYHVPTGVSQRVVWIDNLVLFIIGATDSLYMWRASDSAGSSYSLYFQAFQTNLVRMRYYGDGTFSLWLNGVRADDTFTTNPNGDCGWMRFASNIVTDEFGGMVYDVRISRSGILRHWWPMDEGTNYVLSGSPAVGMPIFYDRVNGKNATGEHTSGAPSWQSVAPFHATQKIRKKLNAGDTGQSIRGRKVKVWMGYTGDFDDYVLVVTSFAQQVKLLNREYSISCSDVTRQIRQLIFEQRRARLSITITAVQTTLTVFDNIGFRPQIDDSPLTYGDVMMKHTASFSDVPGAPYSAPIGYLKVKDTGEIISYTGVTATTFTGCVRGALGTTAFAVTVSGGATADDAPLLEEFVYLELPCVQLAYALITGIVLDTGGAVTLPDHWHVGIATDKINETEWQDIGSDLYDGDAGGLIFKFLHMKATDGKKFVEQEVFRLAGVYAPINTDGTMGLRRITSALSSAVTEFALGNSQIVSHSGITHKENEIVNQYRVDYEWDGELFLRSRLFTDADSIARNGFVKTKVLKFLGLYSSRHSVATIYSLVNAYVNRYRDAPIHINMKVLPKWDVIEAGDIAFVDLGDVQDYADGFNLERPFEIQQTSIDWVNGTVSLNGFASSADKIEEPIYVPDQVLSDGFYISKGSLASGSITISGGVMTADGTLTGTSDMNAAGSVFYVDGDLTIQTGKTLTLENNVQLRVKGTLTIDGTITAVSGGHAGAVDTNTIDVLRVANSFMGTPGFIGTTIASDGYQVLGIGFGIFWTVRTNLGAVTTGQYTEFPSLNLNAGDQSASPLVDIDVAGIPTDMRGSSGGSGGCVLNQNYFVRALGGTGGDSAAGFCVISRGVVFGGAGLIDMSGTDGVAGGARNLPSELAGDARAGTGSGGGPGGCLLLLDGSSVDYPVIGNKFVADIGATVAAGSPMLGSYFQGSGRDKIWGLAATIYTGWNNAPTNGTDLSDSCLSVLYIPD